MVTSPVLRIGALLVLIGALVWSQLRPELSQRWLALTLTKISVGHDESGLTLDMDLGRGLAYSASDSGTATLFDSHTHAALHTYHIGSAIGDVVFDPPHHHAFLAVAGKAPATSDGASLWMIGTETGAVLSRIPVASPVESMAIDTALSHLYIGTVGGVVAVVDTRTGRQVHSIGVSAPISAFTVDRATHRVFALQDYQRLAKGHVPELLMMDGPTGALAWASPVGIDPSSIYLDTTAGRIFVLNLGEAPPISNTVQAFDTGTGILIHSQIVGPDTTSLAVDHPRRHLILLDSLLGTMSILDTRTGMLLRTITLPGQQTYRLILDEGRGLGFFTFLGSRFVTVVDLATGTLKAPIEMDTQLEDLVLDTTQHQHFALQYEQSAVAVLDEPSHT